MIWLYMNQPEITYTLSKSETAKLCQAYSISVEDIDVHFNPCVVMAGLKDIHLLVKDHDTLMRAVQDEAMVSELSRQLDVVGVHMSCVHQASELKAFCSNYAPLYGIPEECATGTSNAGLAWLLYQKGMLPLNQTCFFLQGEHMGQPCKIDVRIDVMGEKQQLKIGGTAKILRMIEL